MAIDSAAKRRRAAGGFGMPVAPVPDGQVSAEDRAQAVGVYQTIGMRQYYPWGGGSLSYRRRWLREALYGGMTNDAYKLGTTLTLGWFWTRRNGCDAAFRRQAGETDRGLIRGVLEPDESQISLTMGGMAAGTRWEFSRVRIAGCGFESAESEQCVVTIGDDGAMKPPAPNRPLQVEAEQLEGGSIELHWRYSDIGEEATPDGFNIYMDSGSGFDYSTPVETVPYGVGGIGGEFSWTSDPLVDGQRYRFCVRSYTDAGGESHNADTAAAVAESQGPAAITGLLASWEEI